MSPREKHIPDDAKKTTVGLTPEDSAAINWIGQSRRNRKDKRTTTNDILVDALWYFLERTEGKTTDPGNVSGRSGGRALTKQSDGIEAEKQAVSWLSSWIGRCTNFSRLPPNSY
jgi:hypothetical protein